MAFAVLKLSYNQLGDSQLEGGICGTGFFIDDKTAITAHHLLNEQTFIPNIGFKHCAVWIITREGIIMPLDERIVDYRPQVECTVLKLERPVKDTKIYRVSTERVDPNHNVLGLGHKSAGMPVTNAHWQADHLVIDEVNLNPFIDDRAGCITRSLEMTVHANDVNLDNVFGYELSFGSRVGMSGGPLVIQDTDAVVGVLSFGLPPDEPIKTNTFAVAIEEIIRIVT